jgi:hypothetical protein
MKTLILYLVLLLLGNNSSRFNSEYDIGNFYSSVEVANDTMVLTSDGDFEEAELILTPTKINVGKYKVNVTRKAKDLYKVDGKDIFIQTKYCYEYATGDEVFISVESTYGYSKGKIIF